MKRSKWHFMLLAFLMTLLLCGCASQLTTQNYTHEAGEKLPIEVTAYATFEKTEKEAEAILNLDGVDPDKVGTYEAVVTLKNKEYPFTVEVVDTTAPEGTFDSFFIVTNQSVQLDAFGLKTEDCSEFTVGFRNQELIKTEEELKDIFKKAMAESEEIQMAEALNIQWELDKDKWEEKDASAEPLKQEIVPEKDGLYRLEIAAVDVHGNATVMNSYALIDTTAPVISGAEDTKVVIQKEIDSENITIEGVTAEDNMLGDLTAQILVSEEIVEELDKDVTGFKAKVTYTVADFVGNETVIERMMDFEFDKKSIVPKQQVVAGKYPVAQDGFNRAMAEEAFALVNQERVAAGLHELKWNESIYNLACTRAQEIVSKWSHERPNGELSDDSIHSIGGYYTTGENISKYGFTAKATVDDWMNSPGHRDNILRDMFTQGCMACYCSGGYYYWVNLFNG